MLAFIRSWAVSFIELLDDRAFRSPKRVAAFTCK